VKPLTMTEENFSEVARATAEQYTYSEPVYRRWATELVAEVDALRTALAAAEARIAALEAELAASREDARAGWTEQGQMALECYALLATANALRATLEKLACLGNGDLPGTSEGNTIAQRALAENAVPAANLAAHDAEVLERAIAEITNRCVRQVGESSLIPGYNRCMDDVERAIERIRALAAQEVKP